MNSVPGLPPLPKSLSGLLTFAGRRESGGPERYSPPVKPTERYSPPVRADSRTESRMDSRPESARSHYSGVGYGASAFEPYYANGSVQGFSPRSSPRSHSSSPRNQSGGGGGTSGGSKSHSPRGSPPVPGSITGNNPRLSPAHVHVPIRQRRPSTLDSQLAVLRKEMRWSALIGGSLVRQRGGARLRAKRREARGMATLAVPGREESVRAAGVRHEVWLVHPDEECGALSRIHSPCGGGAQQAATLRG
ncbi:hypothetical protein GWK47_026184 [Chionoecetes opilio]|uniref:Uncharacterized protein n=1 Tax=Chionoecetes opilio TaxID=41210 RepID=A0A8J8WAK5_CHIOP|nr:hypothetical protein GWK47_026184 [Chionoecetes opilio]